MAYSYVVYTGNGATTDYVVPFPYLDQLHVTATVNGVAASFAWLNATTVRFSPAPPNLQAVRIQRDSSRTARLSNYQDAQILTEAQLDYDVTQVFYVAQEAFDAVGDAPVGGDMRRSMNLADVFDFNAARQNIGAVAKAGDAMTGPLYLAGFPTSPLMAASKGYVDSILGTSSGVSSFNTRTGTVTLVSGDVTTALGYTPVSKAGDVMTGLLTLSADPLSPLGAATKQYVDAHSGGGSTGEWTFPLPDPAKAAAILRKSIVNNTSDRAGTADILTERVAGNTPIVAFMHTYTCDNVGLTGFTGARGDIGLGSVVRGKAATFLAGWFAAVGPRTNPGQGWAAVGLKVNAVERVGDQGLRLDRTGGSYSMGIQVSPDNSIDVGDGTPIGYNGTFGMGFIASGTGASAVRWWNPIYIEKDSIVPNGVGILARGGSSLAMQPTDALDIRDNWLSGINTTGATFNDADHTALWLAGGQCIHFGSLSRIYEDPTGNLTFYDSIVGAKRLQDLVGGGGGVNLLPLDNVWTGKNTFAKINTTMPGYTAQFKSEGNGALANTAMLLTTNYFAAVDVRKTSNVATEQGTTGGSTAVYVQHSASGTNTAANTSIGMRVQMESSAINSGGQSDAVAGYFGIGNIGTNVGAFGVHVDAVHNPASGASSITYGMSVELYRQSLNGNTVGFHVRSQDLGAAYKDNAYGFLASPGGSGGKKINYVFAAGSSLTGTLPCITGVDLSWANPSDAGIRMPAGAYLKFNGGGEQANERYNSGFGTLETRNNGSLRSAFSMGTGVMYQYDGANGSEYQWYFDAAGSSPAVMNVRSGSRTSAPSNPSAIANWLKLQVDGINYWWPLYR
jgi:hypothetical protein